MQRLNFEPQLISAMDDSMIKRTVSVSAVPLVKSGSIKEALNKGKIQIPNEVKDETPITEDMTRRDDVVSSNDSTFFGNQKTFLGMPLAAGITVTVLAACALSFGIYKLVKK